MKKRVFSAVLWFYSGWYAGAMIAHLLGVSVALGPILGFAAAAVIAGESVGLIHDIPSAGEIVERIVTEAEQILSRRRNSSASVSFPSPLVGEGGADSVRAG